MITTTGVTYITPEYATHQRMYTETHMFGKVREVYCRIGGATVDIQVVEYTPQK